MTEAGSFWTILLGSNAVTGSLAYLIPAIVTRKKDAGDLASDLLAQCIADIATLKADNARCQTETALLRELVTRNDIVIRLVVPELHRVSPYSAALAQARDLLGPAFPVPTDTPADMAAVLHAIDAQTQG